MPVTAQSSAQESDASHPGMAVLDGVTLAYQSHGPAEAPAVLLVAGLGEQLTRWPDELIQALLALGYRVICFDNRDSGLSSSFDTAETSDLRSVVRRLAAGETLTLPYGLDHMAQDVLDLLDFLEVPSAHLLGVSLGAMMAQLAAAKQPERIRSLTLVMTGSGEIAHLTPRPHVLLALMSMTSQSSAEGQAVARGLSFAKALAGPAFPLDIAQTEARLAKDYHRACRPLGVLRQLGAILTQGDRRAALAAITAPTEIVHGSADPLLGLEGARRTAAAIRHARLTVIDGMGHDLAPALVGTVAEHFRRAAHRSLG